METPMRVLLNQEVAECLSEVLRDVLDRDPDNGELRELDTALAWSEAVLVRGDLHSAIEYNHPGTLMKMLRRMVRAQMHSLIEIEKSIINLESQCRTTVRYEPKDEFADYDLDIEDEEDL